MNAIYRSRIVARECAALPWSSSLYPAGKHAHCNLTSQKGQRTLSAHTVSEYGRESREISYRKYHSSSGKAISTQIEQLLEYIRTRGLLGYYGSYHKKQTEAYGNLGAHISWNAISPLSWRMTVDGGQGAPYLVPFELSPLYYGGLSGGSTSLRDSTVRLGKRN